jgi:hypothetical protein
MAEWKLPSWDTIWHVLVFIMIVFIFAVEIDNLNRRSSFVNFNDSQYNQRYVAADVPVAAQQSLQDRLNAATANIGMQSNMSGNRDPPVFWSGYNNDMSMVKGNVYNTRENSVADTMSAFNNPLRDCGIEGKC